MTLFKRRNGVVFNYVYSNLLSKIFIIKIKRSSCSFFTGTTGEINKEMDGQILLKRAIKRFEGGEISNIGTTIVNVEVTTDYPLVSAISMIAPSPDWFVGVRDYSLCNTTTGKWVDKREDSYHSMTLAQIVP